MKTALELAIDQMEEADYFQPSDLRMINFVLKGLIRVERQNIIDAYEQDLYAVNGITKYNDGKDYFEQTFKTKVN